MKIKAIKHDEDKLRFDLIPVYPLKEVAKAFTAGAKKYDDRNWENGAKWHRYYRAAVGHLLDFWDRVERDPETGIHPLGAAAANIFILLEYLETHPDLDDRPKPEVKMT